MCTACPAGKYTAAGNTATACTDCAAGSIVEVGAGNGIATTGGTTCTPCGEVPDFISPFKVAPECYQVLAENDDFVTGMMTMKPGESDPVHHHKDHLIFVLEGEEITIYPCGDQAAAMTVPIAFGAGIPAPMSAPPFGKHSLRNTGKTTVKMLFFESKK